MMLAGHLLGGAASARATRRAITRLVRAISLAVPRAALLVDTALRRYCAARDPERTDQHVECEPAPAAADCPLPALALDCWMEALKVGRAPADDKEEVKLRLTAVGLALTALEGALRRPLDPGARVKGDRKTLAAAAVSMSAVYDRHAGASWAYGAPAHLWRSMRAALMRAAEDAKDEASRAAAAGAPDSAAALHEGPAASGSADAAPGAASGSAALLMRLCSNRRSLAALTSAVRNTVLGIVRSRRRGGSGPGAAAGAEPGEDAGADEEAEAEAGAAASDEDEDGRGFVPIRYPAGVAAALQIPAVAALAARARAALWFDTSPAALAARAEAVAKAGAVEGSTLAALAAVRATPGGCAMLMWKLQAQREAWLAAGRRDGRLSPAAGVYASDYEAGDDVAKERAEEECYDDEDDLVAAELAAADGDDSEELDEGGAGEAEDAAGPAEAAGVAPWLTPAAAAALASRFPLSSCKGYNPKQLALVPVFRNTLRAVRIEESAAAEMDMFDHGRPVPLNKLIERPCRRREELGTSLLTDGISLHVLVRVRRGHGGDPGSGGAGPSAESGGPGGGAQPEAAATAGGGGGGGGRPSAAQAAEQLTALGARRAVRGGHAVLNVDPGGVTLLAGRKNLANGRASLTRLSARCHRDSTHEASANARRAAWEAPLRAEGGAYRLLAGVTPRTADWARWVEYVGVAEETRAAVLAVVGRACWVKQAFATWRARQRSLATWCGRAVRGCLADGTAGTVHTVALGDASWGLHKGMRPAPQTAAGRALAVAAWAAGGAVVRKDEYLTSATCARCRCKLWDVLVPAGRCPLERRREAARATRWRPGQRRPGRLRTSRGLRYCAACARVVDRDAGNAAANIGAGFAALGCGLVLPYLQRRGRRARAGGRGGRGRGSDGGGGGGIAQAGAAGTGSWPLLPGASLSALRPPPRAGGGGAGPRRAAWLAATRAASFAAAAAATPPARGAAPAAAPPA